MSPGVVPDTNVILAAARSRRDDSPNGEILELWQQRLIRFLFSRDTVMEYAEKLLELGWDRGRVVDWLARLELLGESVEILWFHLEAYPEDKDDVAFLLCALNGRATHLVTYDEHLLILNRFYQPELRICRPLEFLRDYRARIEAG